MKIEEIMKKDWQVLTASGLIMNSAYLLTILQMQSEILAKLTGQNNDVMFDKIMDQYKINVKKMEDYYLNDLPNYKKP